MTIPDWLKAGQAPAAVGPRWAVGAGREKFLDRTLARAVSFLKDTAFNEEVSGRRGFLQAIDPRLKLAGTLALIVALSLENSIPGIALYLLLFAALALLSGIPPFRLLKKILPAFVFTALIALPSILNVIVPGREVLTLFELESPLSGIFGIKRVSVTDNGLLSAATLVMRVTASVLAVFMQTMTTRPSELIKAVTSFLPGTLKPIFSISYRYIFFLLRRLEEFITAFRARSFSRVSAESGRRWAASRMAAMFSISLRLGHDLGMAMESRGYTLSAGEPALKRAFRPALFDLVWAALVTLMLLRSFV